MNTIADSIMLGISNLKLTCTHSDQIPNKPKYCTYPGTSAWANTEKYCGSS